MSRSRLALPRVAPRQPDISLTANSPEDFGHKVHPKLRPRTPREEAPHALLAAILDATTNEP